MITVNKTILKNLEHYYCTCILTARLVVIVMRYDIICWENIQMYVQCRNIEFVSGKFRFVTTEGFLVYSSSGKITGRLRYLDHLIVSSLKYSFWKIWFLPFWKKLPLFEKFGSASLSSQRYTIVPYSGSMWISTHLQIPYRQVTFNIIFPMYFYA